MKIYAHGEYMPVNEVGMITRYGSKEFSGQWRLLGAVRINNFGHIVECRGFDGSLLQIKDWQFKNGKQQWFVIDYDHGTRRQWTGFHKVVSDNY